ncbi:ATP-binding cassette domain-containing protein [Govanella unica]|uniref:ATP-binding cassette domain-containing protein n=1 Tax=Govanella unica TaxID=2975056 RepID=A0A9X3Z6Y6_9PROT|nr:ATP-binding cassette domain-containing protein [Govania unica]MDA5193680.1 ATP-binding cassette domain-containing protein [Govania unica]
MDTSKQRLQGDAPPKFFPLTEALSILWQASDPGSRQKLGIALLLVLASSLLGILAPVLLKLMVDGFSRREPDGLLLLLSAYVLALGLMRALAELKSSVHASAEQGILRRLSQRLFAHLLALPLRFHLDQQTGAMGRILENGLLGYRLTLQHVMFSALPVLIELVMMGLILMHFGHAGILLILALAAASYGLAFGLGLRHIAGPARAISRSHVAASALLTDSLLNQETIKSFNAGPQIEARYDGALRGIEQSWRCFFRQRTLNGCLVAVVLTLSLAASLLYAGHEVRSGRMTLGDFILVNSYLLQTLKPLEMLGIAARDMTQGMAFIENLISLLRQSGEAQSRGPQQALADGGLEVRFENVSFSYHGSACSPAEPTLREVSFKARPGATIALVGASGSGKSTVARLLLRLLDPDAGRILLNDIPIVELSLRELRGAIAIVPQDILLFHDTIARNIAFGRPGSNQAEIEEAARQAHIHDVILQLPEGYDTIVGERGLKLSGGEKQRIAIARAALTRPRIWVCDEATSALDSGTEQKILRTLIAESRRTTTYLIIAHRLQTILQADEILVFDQGRIVERGTHEVLLARKGVYRELWRLQQRSQEEGSPPTLTDEPGSPGKERLGSLRTNRRDQGLR